MVNSRFAVLVHCGLTLVSIFFIYELGRGHLNANQELSVNTADIAAFNLPAASGKPEVAARQSFDAPALDHSKPTAPLNSFTLAFAASEQRLYAHAPASLAPELNTNLQSSADTTPADAG